MRRLFWARWTILYIAHIKQENNVGDDFIEDVRTFLLSIFLSTFDKYLPGVLKILNNNEFLRWLCWRVELLLFSNLLQPKLKLFFLFDHRNEFCDLMSNVFTDLSHMSWKLIVVENEK